MKRPETIRSLPSEQAHLTNVLISGGYYLPDWYVYAADRRLRIEDTLKALGCTPVEIENIINFAINVSLVGPRWDDVVEQVIKRLKEGRSVAGATFDVMQFYRKERGG